MVPPGSGYNEPSHSKNIALVGGALFNIATIVCKLFLGLKTHFAKLILPVRITRKLYIFCSVRK